MRDGYRRINRRFYRLSADARREKVYSIDVGYGQLAWKLRQDPRVVCMERTNIRKVTPDMLDDVPEFAVIDVSFISLKLVLPVVAQLLNEHGRIACLIKPQFEAGKGKVGKKGVVREPEIHLMYSTHLLKMHTKPVSMSII